MMEKIFIIKLKNFTGSGTARVVAFRSLRYWLMFHNNPWGIIITIINE